MATKILYTSILTFLGHQARSVFIPGLGTATSVVSGKSFNFFSFISASLKSGSNLY